MILSFKHQFVPKIFDGTKIHTIREDKHNRWFAGRMIQMATGARTKKYKQFDTHHCTGVQPIKILWEGTYLKIFIYSKLMVDFNIASHWSEHSENGYNFLCRLAVNDGFINFFSKNFSGNIIHWTNFKY